MKQRAPVILDVVSRANPRLKTLLGEKDRYYAFEGEKLVRDILARGARLKVLAVTGEFPGPDDWTGIRADEIWRVSPGVMEKLSSLTEKTTAWAAAAEAPRPLTFNGELPLECPVALVLDNIQDPANAGTAIRCAAAFGVGAAILTGDSVKPNHPKFLRAAQNAIFDVRLRSFPSLETVIEQAQAAGYRVYLTSSHPDAERVAPEEAIPPCLIVFGNEGRGIDPAYFQRFPAICIRQTDRVESLNAGVSACIVMHELAKRLLPDR